MYMYLKSFDFSFSGGKPDIIVTEPQVVRETLWYGIFMIIINLSA